MIPKETPAVQNITPVETPAVPETPAAPVDEQQYEYVEVPADQVPADAQQYEYVEVPADQIPADAQQYEYVEVPADQVPADAQQYEYVEVPADQVPADAQQYEYVEVPADQAVQDFGVEKLDELGETPTVENVTPAETVAELETVAPPAETYDFASLEMPETAAPVTPKVAVEDITPVETIPEPDVAAPAVAPVETVAEPETVVPPAAADAPAATLQETLETPETETVIDGGAQSLTPEDKIYSAEELETPEVENITPVETVAEPDIAAPPAAAVEDITPAEAITEPDVAASVETVAEPETVTPVETVAEPETAAPPAAVAVPAEVAPDAPAAAQIAEETQEELDPPEISDTLSAPAPDVEAAAMQETADMTQQAETAQEVLAGETAEVENVPPAETVAEPDVATPVETAPEPETVAPAEAIPEPETDAPDAPPAAAVAPVAVEDITPAETIPEPDVAVPVETVAEPETVVPPAASVVPDAPVAPAAPEGFVFKDGDGQKSFTAESAAQSVTIDTADLSRWMIVLNQISVSPVEAAAGQQIELSPDMYCQGQLIGATGDVMPFANMANVPVPEFSPDPVQSATLFFSGVSIIPLANQGGVTMDLGGANGVVVNTNGDMLYFANLSALTLIETPAPVAETPETPAPAPDAPPAAVAVPAAPAATIPAYAFAPVPAPLNDAVVFSADSESAQVDGNDGKPHILVKANDRLLGWHVDFATAGRMSLADVKAYQAAHGDLPEHDGVLTFKDKSLTFKNILSIRVFDTPAYCGYGIAPAV